MAARGRPSRYTKKIGDQICKDIANGLSLRKACLKHKNLNVSTVLEWVLNPKFKEFSDQYAHSRRIQAEIIGDEIFDIADDGRNDWLIRELDNGEGIEIPNHEHINRSRLRVDTRKWYLSKVLPKIYGDKPEPPKKESDLKPHEATEVIVEAEPMPERYKRES